MSVDEFATRKSLRLRPDQMRKSTFLVDFCFYADKFFGSDIGKNYIYQMPKISHYFLIWKWGQNFWEQV